MSPTETDTTVNIPNPDTTGHTDNDTLHKFIENMVDAAQAKVEISNDKHNDYAAGIRHWAMNLERHILDLPSMEDMTAQQRHGLAWAQAWDIDGRQCVITRPVVACPYDDEVVDECVTVLYRDGTYDTLYHNEVVPRPHLEPMTWPSASTHVVNSVDDDEAGTENDDQVVTELTNVTEVDAVGGPVDGYPSTGWRANTDSHYLGADEKVWWFDGNNWNNGNEVRLSYNLSPEHEPYVVYDPHFEPDGIYLDGEDMNTLWERVDGAWVFGHTERERQEKRGQGLGYVSPPLKHGPYERVSTKQY